VQVTYTTVCPVTSNAINWTMTGLVSALNANFVQLFPNPASNTCVVDYTGFSDDALTLRIVTLTGQTVLLNTNRLSAGNRQQHVLDLHALPAGAYLLVLETGSGERLTLPLLHN
jgi:Secretion system C-terminal sorting domain